MTVAGLIDRVEQRFREHELYYGHGTDNPRDEAAWLVLGALDLPLSGSVDDLAREPEPEQVERAWRLAEERIERRRPLAYLLQRAWFCGLPFHVDERVLIPRSPLAELIEDRLAPWVNEDSVRRILDIGTGSGCIAVACALAFPGSEVDAVDTSEEALQVARHNIDMHEVAGCVRALRSDLFQELRGRRYDLIVANPPYVPAGEVDTLPAEYRHEPVVPALAAGEQGLDAVRRILAEAAGFLTDSGLLVVEVGNSRPALEAAFPGLPFTWLEFERGGEGVFLLHADQLQ